MAKSPSRLCLLLALLCCSFQLARCNNTQINYRDKKEKQVLDKILGPGRYDATMKPPGHGGTDHPTIVLVDFLLQSIGKIDDREMKYSIQLIFRQEWRDERLKYFEFEDHLKYLTLTEASAVWKPDLFFTNEIGGDFHNITKPNLFIRTFPYGTVLYSSRISLTLTCPMNLKMYPLDRQVCSLKIASYGWTTDVLKLMWKENDLVEVAKDLHVPGFTLEKTVKDYYNTLTNAGEYSCLKVDFFFKRLFSYYLIHIYIPYFMLVIVSWISFWLDQEAVLARVLLGVTTLLTMAVQTFNINASVPPVSYIKAIDVWTGVCLTFIFGALLEFFLVNYASRSDMRREIMKKKRRSMDATPNQKDADSNTIFTMKPLTRQSGEPPTLENVPREMQPPRPNCCKIWLSKFPTGSKRIDVISRITFPLMFALFNLVYWSTYL